MSINLLFKRLLVLLIITNSYSQNQVSGKIENITSPYLILKNNFYKTIDTIKINIKTGKFNYKSNLPTGYYYINHNNESIDCYLIKNSNTQIFFDAKNIYQSLKYQGDMANENNYLAKKENLSNTIPLKKRIYSGWAFLDEKSFLKLTDSVNNLYRNLFNKQKKLSQDFKELESVSLQIQKQIKIATFENRKQMVENNPNYKVSGSYPNPFEEVSLNEPKYLITYDYSDYLGEYINQKASKIWNRDKSKGYPIIYLNQIKDSNLDIKISEQLAFQITEIGLSYVKDLEAYYKTYNSIVKNKKYLNYLEEYYQSKKGTKKKKSADFKFHDIDGKIYSLKDFRGKYIYIDLWASWCRGCLLQIPHLKKLKKEFSDKINFVSISYRDKKENWKYALNQNKLKGIQLFSMNENNDFFKFYNIQSIPRFILLDKKGNIIDSNAKVPSEKSIREFFRKLD